MGMLKKLSCLVQPLCIELSCVQCVHTCTLCTYHPLSIELIKKAGVALIRFSHQNLINMLVFIDELKLLLRRCLDFPDR